MSWTQRLLARIRAPFEPKRPPPETVDEPPIREAATKEAPPAEAAPVEASPAVEPASLEVESAPVVAEEPSAAEEVSAAEELQLTDRAAWHDLRDQLRTRQEARCAQSRFRKDPDAYLQALEDRLPQPRLPP